MGSVYAFQSIAGGTALGSLVGCAVEMGIDATGRCLLEDQAEVASTTSACGGMGAITGGASGAVVAAAAIPDDRIHQLQ